MPRHAPAATPAAAPVKAFGTHTAVTAALPRKQIAENVISMRFNFATQGRAIRRAAPMRYRWMRISGINTRNITGSRTTRSSSGTLQG